MNWNKTELFGDNILLMGQVTTDPEAENYQATRHNMKELEKTIIELQEWMIKNNIDHINLSWSGTKVIKQMKRKIDQTDSPVIINVDKSNPN